MSVGAIGMVAVDEDFESTHDVYCFFLFFFSSRRRHTRLQGGLEFRRVLFRSAANKLCVPGIPKHGRGMMMV